MSLTITKVDAARSQIDTAIELWFHDRDPVSIYTLGCAGLDVLNALGALIGERAMMLDPSRFKEGKFGDWLRTLAAVRNFFKHADREPEGVLDFEPSANDYLLVDCVDTFNRVTRSQTVSMQAYLAYFTIRNPEFFGPPVKEPVPVEFLNLTKKQFFEGFLSELG